VTKKLKQLPIGYDIAVVCLADNQDPQCGLGKTAHDLNTQAITICETFDVPATQYTKADIRLALSLSKLSSKQDIAKALTRH